LVFVLEIPHSFPIEFASISKPSFQNNMEGDSEPPSTAHLNLDSTGMQCDYIVNAILVASTVTVIIVPGCHPYKMVSESNI
jgi:hypothetical protein